MYGQYIVIIILYTVIACCDVHLIMFIKVIIDLTKVPNLCDMGT